MSQVLNSTWIYLGAICQFRNKAQCESLSRTTWGLSQIYEQTTHRCRNTLHKHGMIAIKIPYQLQIIIYKVTRYHKVRNAQNNKFRQIASLF